MERKYRVKVNDGVSFEAGTATSLIDGYLAFCGEICLYSAGEARKKAGMFKGKVERFTSPIIEGLSQVNMMQLSRKVVCDGLIAALDGNEAFFDADATNDERIYMGTVFSEILSTQEELKKHKAKFGIITDKETLEQLGLLNQLVNTDYFMLIDEK